MLFLVAVRCRWFVGCRLVCCYLFVFSLLNFASCVNVLLFLSLLCYCDCVLFEGVWCFVCCDWFVGCCYVCCWLCVYVLFYVVCFVLAVLLLVFVVLLCLMRAVCC